MAPPVTSRPLRGLIALLIVLVGLLAWAFWPGTPNTVRLGLDLQGGTQVILVPKPVTAGAEITDEQLQQTVAIIRQRVDGLGVAEAEVTTQGSGNGAAIIVSVPGAEQDRVVDLVKRTALLDFRPVDTLLNPQPFDINATPTPEPSASASASGSATPSPTPSPTTTFVPGTSLVQSPDNSAAYQGEVLALDCTNPRLTPVVSQMIRRFGSAPVSAPVGLSTTWSRRSSRAAT